MWMGPKNPQCSRHHARQVCCLIATAWRQLRIACATRRLPLVLLFLLLRLAAAQAQNYTWTINDGTVTITGYTGPGGAATIPNSINRLPGTSIGDYAFEN